jgi:hypothetical protein
MVSTVPPGPVRVNIAVDGFKNSQQELQLSANQPGRVGTTLEVGAVTETVSVTAAGSSSINSRSIQELSLKQLTPQANAASQNVYNLQRRVAGILPVKVDVPSSGKSYRFVRPLVLDEETKITFQYKSK